MRHQAMMGLLPLCLCGLLSACASAPQVRLVPEVKLVRLEPPAALLDCPVSPDVPMVQTQRDVARYVVALEAAGAACRQALAEVKAWSMAGP